MKKPVTKAELIAKEFSRILKKELGANKFREMVDKHLDTNAVNEYWCVSHDFCDANMPMAEAFKNVTGDEVDTQNDEQLKRWNKAWDIAKKNNFYAVIQING